MRYRIWLLALVVSMGLACVKDKASNTNPNAAEDTPTPPTYKLTVNFEGLVGYVTTNTGAVWALLPNADRTVTPAPFTDTTDAAHYPRHFAVLKVDGRNVRGFDKPIELQIPIDGYNIEVTSVLPTGNPSPGFIASKFGQATSATAPGVDKLKTGMLSTPVSSRILAARMRLPTTDLDAILSTHPVGNAFETVTPQPVTGRTFCTEQTANTRNQQRVEFVTWSPSRLTTDVELTLSPLNPPDPNHPQFTLTLHPETPGKDFNITIANQVAESILNPHFHPAHWAAYRWFYNLSDAGSVCTTHYYPDGPRGGNRCPQKLYWE